MKPGIKVLFMAAEAETFGVQSQIGPIQAAVYKTELNGLTVYLVGGNLFPKDAPVYSGDNYIDGRKFTFFSLAAPELTCALNWMPDVLHANDWHTAPAIYKLWLQKKLGTYDYNTATLLGLHYLPYLCNGANKAAGSIGL